jgi:hypothetical protein
MKKLFYTLLLFVFFPVIATAQWGITPEIGVLFSGAIGGGEVTVVNPIGQYFTETIRYNPKIGYSFGCKVGYRLLFGLKFSSGVYYTQEAYDFTSGWRQDDNMNNRLVFSSAKYGSLSIPVLLGYEHYFGKILVSANVGAAYNYGLTLFVNDNPNRFPAMKGRNTVNIIADIGGGYKISKRLILKLMLDYSQRMNYFIWFYNNDNYLGMPYHIGVKAGMEILL